jgi:hypothetical protein
VAADRLLRRLLRARAGRAQRVRLAAVVLLAAQGASLVYLAILALRLAHAQARQGTRLKPQRTYFQRLRYYYSLFTAGLAAS